MCLNSTFIKFYKSFTPSMKNIIDIQYIETTIEELKDYFGIKKPISGKNIFSLIKNGKVKEAIKLIAWQLDLPVDVNVIVVSKGYKSNSQFCSKHLAKVNRYGSEGIIAQVSIPASLPLYGSLDLNGYVIDVKISESCIKYPKSFTVVMAHELSHVLLYSLRHPKKNNEIYTDLLAMMLGFQTIFRDGRKVTTTEEQTGIMETIVKTTTTTYGYLSDEQFDFAFEKINSILKEYRKQKHILSKELKKFTKLLSKYEKLLFKFQKFVEYLSKNTDKNISAKDGKKIATFFQIGYIDELTLYGNISRKHSKVIKDFLKNLSRYTTQILTYIEKLKSDFKKLKEKLKLLKENIKVIEKYVDFIYKIRIFFTLCFYSKKYFI